MLDRPRRSNHHSHGHVEDTLSAFPRKYLHAAWATAFVVLVVVANLVGAHLIRASRQDAVRTAVLGMQLDLVERVRALDATLGAARATLEFLAASPPLAGLPEGLRDRDPARARQARLEAEGDLLRFLLAHPELERVFVEDGRGRPVLAVGRRASAAVPIPPASIREAAEGRLRARLPLTGGEGHLVADIHPAGLLSSLATGTGRAVLLDETGTPLAGTPEAYRRIQQAPADLVAAGEGVARKDGWAVAASHLEVTGFGQPLTWRLVRAESERDVLVGVADVAGRYRTALILNAAAMAATLTVGIAALRLAARRARLEEKAAREAELRALESRLHEADRLAAVGRISATLAHEVRNPLEGMRNWLMLAEDEARRAGGGRTLEYTGKVREGIDTLTSVVRRVLELARPSAGRLEPLDLADVVRTVVGSVDGTRGFRAVSLEITAPEGLPLVRGDRVLLGQLVLNLLINARDAMPEGGTVLLALASESNHVTLAVSDTGPGIPESLLPRLFEPFATGRSSTGIGLSLCRRVAEVHGGTLRASNRPEGGALFLLTLPREGGVAPVAALSEAAS